MGPTVSVQKRQSLSTYNGELEYLVRAGYLAGEGMYLGQGADILPLIAMHKNKSQNSSLVGVSMTEGEIASQQALITNYLSEPYSLDELFGRHISTQKAPLQLSQKTEERSRISARFHHKQREICSELKVPQEEERSYLASHSWENYTFIPDDVNHRSAIRYIGKTQNDYVILKGVPFFVYNYERGIPNPDLSAMLKDCARNGALALASDQEPLEKELIGINATRIFDNELAALQDQYPIARDQQIEVMSHPEDFMVSGQKIMGGGFHPGTLTLYLQGNFSIYQLNW